MTESSITERAAPEQADTRRRIWAIVGASSGNLVEWFDFTSTHSARSILPIYSFHPEIPPLNFTNGRRIRRRISDASYRWLAVWSDR